MLSHSKPDKDFRFYPPRRTLESFIKIIVDQLKTKKCNAILFEKPDTVNGGYESEIIEELNRKLKDNPDARMPKGYVKKLEKKIDYVYELPRNLPIDESYRTVYETMDTLFNDLFGIHIIEPLSEVYLIAKV